MLCKLTLYCILFNFKVNYLFDFRIVTAGNVCANEQINCKAKQNKKICPYLVSAWPAEPPLYKRPQDEMNGLQGISGCYNWW